MEQLHRGMVITVNLDPTKGSETGKTRPCIIVTNDAYNQKSPVIQIVPITAYSAKKNRIITNVALPATKANGLTKKSIADCLQTRPIDRRMRFGTVFGQLSEEEMELIDEALRFVFAL